jgi:YVTN family beta-propeller protein
VREAGLEAGFPRRTLVVMAESSPPESAPTDAAVRTFLIADVRGYTRFTQEQGDEAAGELAAAFAELAREAVVSCGGEVIELRGDEALSVFGSARQALRAAVELQTRFRRRTANGPAFPLPIGIGLDAGEAVPVEGGYRGGPLNTAARLCSLAGPGEILATDTVVKLARRLEGIRFVARRPVRLKGLDEAVRVIEVVPETPLPPLPEVPARKRPRITRGGLAVAAVAGLALVAAMVALALTRSGGPDFLPRLDANSIGIIDAEAVGITEQLTIGSKPSAIAAGGGFVWVASEADGTVSRIDPTSRRVRTFDVGQSATGLAYGSRSLWVTNGEERTLVQINPDALSVVQPIAVENGPGPVAVGEDAVWVANTIDGTVSRIDLARGEAAEPVPVGPNPAGIAVGMGAVWVTSQAGGSVLRLDPGSGEVVGAVAVGNGPTGVAVGEGSLWVANRQDGTVSRIDPASNSVAATIPVGASPTGIAAGNRAIWVANEGDGTIARIDPDADRVDETIPVESSPSALALAKGAVWATTLPSLAAHRGGVLRIESVAHGCNCIDPAGGSFPEIQFVFHLVYDGLLAYRHVGGIAGGGLVSNLAARVPTPADEGRTYTFQLRSGISYSDGTPVQASDVRFSLERLLTLNPEIFLGYFSGIVGASDCSARPPERCDLSTGIEVDDATGRITIRLTEPDPDFLYKLAFPWASVVPTGTPLRLAKAEPIPSTGPYRIASFDPDELRLVRNTHFRVWSPDARPDGYPNEIRFHLSEDVDAQLAAVERGRADWMFGPPVERLKGILTRYPGRLHSDAAPWTDFMFLNTRVPPFHDLRVRQALNYAVDREGLVEVLGGTLVARTTCQILPPAFPGYRPYCPYTRSPNSGGIWTAPDFAKAEALVRASGTRGMRVEVFAYEAFGRVEYGRHFVSLLRRLGYQSSLRVIPSLPDYGEYVADSRNRAQIGSLGWYADSTAPALFLRDLFSCGSFVPESPSNQNLSAFCDPEIDAGITRAAAVQRSDPVRANALWVEVDRALVDRAAAVPLVNQRGVVFVSERVGNHEFHPQWGTLFDQLWVK